MTAGLRGFTYQMGSAPEKPSEHHIAAGFPHIILRLLHFSEAIAITVLVGLGGFHGFSFLQAVGVEVDGGPDVVFAAEMRFIDLASTRLGAAGQGPLRLVLRARLCHGRAGNPNANDEQQERKELFHDKSSIEQ